MSHYTSFEIMTWEGFEFSMPKVNIIISRMIIKGSDEIPVPSTCVRTLKHSLTLICTNFELNLTFKKDKIRLELN